MKSPFRCPLTNSPSTVTPSFCYLNRPCLTSMSQVPSCSSLRALMKYFPLPCFLLSLKEPSQVSPLEQVILPYPWTLSWWKLPIYSKESLPLLTVSLPCPSLFPSTYSPSQRSPLPYLSTPLPWNLPSLKLPSKFLSLNTILPFPTFSLFLNCPSQTVPLGSLSTPWPSFLPWTNSPSYSVLFLRLMSLPKPWYQSWWKPPLQSAAPLRKYSPQPSFMLSLKSPLQRMPELVSKVPFLNSSSSNSPVNLSPSAKMNSQLMPCFLPLRIVPLNLEPSLQLTSPLVKQLSVNMPLKVPQLAYLHTPYPCGSLLSLNSPLKEEESEAQNISPLPWGRPRSSHSPLNRPFFSFSSATGCACGFG